MTTKRHWEKAFLKEKSFQKDPLGDDLVKQIIQSGGLDGVRKLFSQLTDNDDILTNSNADPAVIAYFNAELSLPDWADQEKIKIAQSLFASYGPEIAFMLNFRSLPLCYSSKSGSKVLYSTGRLREEGQNTSKITRRLMETSQMVVNVLSPGGLEPTGKGIVTIKKVRLMHASIRYYLENKAINTRGWDEQELGAPINQEEMAGTLMAFGPLVIKGLNLIGIETSTEEKDAFVHVWNIVGHFIGLGPDLMPKNYEEGWDLGIAIISRNYHESYEGKQLTTSLVAFGKAVFPGTFFDTLPEYFIDRFTRDVSQEVGISFPKLLGIDPKPTLKRRFFTWLSEWVFDKMSDFQKRSRLANWFAQKVNEKLLQGLINFYLKDRHAEFYIPPSLKENWHLKK